MACDALCSMFFIVCGCQVRPTGIPLTEVTLPFAYPIAVPLSFE
jgi:hypothetical protein